MVVTCIVRLRLTMGLYSCDTHRPTVFNNASSINDSCYGGLEVIRKRASLIYLKAAEYESRVKPP